ncbi:tandem-95 repeat protein [Rhodoferax sp.]|uniref:tandem-95 repeat protein n=1 Tax=Rhodoferax sp. TaxID=50421 RepID=UPI002ACD7E0B|nr:tandem-95 repeat protein [Rhodoferax sp.]MDZ7919885.1 tandem-95 repeat protein [Rhodoferax sp.]
MLLDLPKVAGEVLAGTEDTVLRIGTDLLLANDSTVNAGANGGRARCASVRWATPSHGQVSLQTSVNGAGDTVTEVVFLPDPDFYGTASFSYTVTDHYGLSSTATATLLVDNVNDAPYAQGEVVSGASEDATFLINKTVLLANDGDVDDATSTLAIGWVGNAVNGTVSLDANGNVVFAPGLNFNGNAEFEYMTVDPAGLLSPTVQVVMPVAAVNDAPLAVDDQFQTYVNSTMTIGFSQLIGNDSDVENDVLSLVNVGNASHGVVSIVNGQVEFVPTAGFIGAASFDYLG